MSPASNQPRHLHPKELGLVLAISPTVDFGSAPRAANCLLGQVASPMQSLWIFAHLLRAVAQSQATVAFIEPVHALESYQRLLLQQAKHHIQAAEDDTTHVTLKLPAGPSIQIRAATSTTAGQLLQAEKISLSWGDGQWLQVQDMNIPPEQSLISIATKDITLERRPKRQRTQVGFRV